MAQFLKRIHAAMRMFKGLHYLRELIAFGWPFLRTYRVRFFSGVALGVAYAAINGLSVGVAPLIVNRLQTEPPPIVNKAQVSTPTSAAAFPKNSFQEALDPILKPIQEYSNNLKTTSKAFSTHVKDFLDQWLPRKGRTVTSQEIFGAIFLISFLTTMRGLLNYLSVYCMSWANERMIQDMRCAVVEKLNTLSLSFFNRSTTAELTQRIDQDTSSLQRAFVLGMPDLVKEPLTLFFIACWLTYIDWQLALFAFIFLPACVVPAVILGKKLKKISFLQRQTGVSQGNLILQVLANIRVVKAFGLEKEQGENYRSLSDQLVSHNINANKKKTMVNPIIESVSGVAMGALLAYVFYAGYNLGEIAGFILALGLSFAPIKKLSALNMLLQQTSIGVHRLLDLFKEQPTVKDREKGIVLNGFKDKIVFSNASFSYGDDLVLKDFNLTIPYGSKLGIVGESGSGKSTLVNLLFRFYDVSSGHITIDGNPLPEITVNSLRQQMALVSQEVLLFNRSVAENISYGRTSATRAEIEAAGRAAYADHFIKELPQGYDTLVGECGNRLSGGQRQRIALARAFVRKAPILVLDEATAALDSDSEKEIQLAIDALTSDQTVISVAHRLATLQSMDQIIVLEKGLLVEQGSFQELLKLNGIFTRLAAHQGIHPS